jgi:hypothetical protein
MLDAVLRARDISPTEREKSWRIISTQDWYEKINKIKVLRPGDLEGILAMTIIPDLAQPSAVEDIARWARDAPVPMIDCLLGAAQADAEETWIYVMKLLTPALASRWANDKGVMRWDEGRAMRSTAAIGRRGRGVGFWRWLMFWRR